MEFINLYLDAYLERGPSGVREDLTPAKVVDRREQSAARQAAEQERQIAQQAVEQERQALRAQQEARMRQRGAITQHEKNSHGASL